MAYPLVSPCCSMDEAEPLSAEARSLNDWKCGLFLLFPDSAPFPFLLSVLPTSLSNAHHRRPTSVQPVPHTRNVGGRNFPFFFLEFSTLLTYLNIFFDLLPPSPPSARHAFLSSLWALNPPPFDVPFSLFWRVFAFLTPVVFPGIFFPRATDGGTTSDATVSLNSFLLRLQHEIVGLPSFLRKTIRLLPPSFVPPRPFSAILLLDSPVYSHYLEEGYFVFLPLSSRSSRGTFEPNFPEVPSWSDQSLLFELWQQFVLFPSLPLVAGTRNIVSRCLF